MPSGFWVENGTAVALVNDANGTIDMWWVSEGNIVVLRQTEAEPNFPAERAVLAGTAYGYSLEYHGTFFAPPESKVKVGYLYGASGTEYQGSLGPEGFAPTAPVLAVANGGNSTATATITGAENATTQTIYSQPWSGSTWTSRATIANNGSASFAMAPGAYWFKATSVNAYASADSNVVFQTITDSGSSSFVYSLLEAVRDTINAAGIVNTGGTDVSAVIAWPPDWDTWTTARVYVLPDSETLEPAMSGIDDATYGVNVVFCEHGVSGTSLSPQTQARKDVQALFVGKRLSALPEVWCEGLTDSRTFDAEQLKNYHGILPMAMRFRTRVQR